MNQQTQGFQIEGTGGFPATNGELPDFFFQHLVLPLDSNASHDELEKLASIHQVDFISKVEEGTISFVHVSRPEHLLSIQNYGLLASEYVGDLGAGIYLIEEDDSVATENLMDYLESLCKEGETLLIVKGTYHGTYTRCLYGEGHEGYVVVKETVLSDCISEWSEKKQDDIWFTAFDT